MGQDINKIEKLYDTVAKEYVGTFSGEHKKNQKTKQCKFIRTVKTSIADKKLLYYNRSTIKISASYEPATQTSPTSSSYLRY